MTERLPLQRRHREIQERAAGWILFRVRRDGDREYLILRNARHHSWGFPKGHVEGGETERCAALRELLEETGLRPIRALRRFTHRSIYAFPRGGETIVKQLTLFLGEAANDKVKLSSEHDRAKWERPRRASWYVRRFPNLVQAVDEAEAHLDRSARE